MPASQSIHVMIVLRSALFYLVWLLVTAGFFILMPLILAPTKYGWPFFASYIRVQVWLLRVICGQKVEISGLDNVPDGPVILASRHESAWETLYLPILLKNPVVILKKEILRYPVAGAISRKLGYIGIDRAGSLEQTREIIDLAKDRVANGQSFLIFPSGTRAPQHRDRVQSGVAVIYRALSLPCVPITLNSGDCWPYKSWLRKPGTISVKILEPIPAGQRTSAFLTRLTRDLADRA